MANQLMKDKKTVALIETWRKSPSPLQRRCFWYYQGRLRWMGKIPPGDTASLLEAIESNPPGVRRPSFYSFYSFRWCFYSF